ncbi:MAG: hypothetical protein D6820_02785, partial [Lentisphaerae bacterium]
NTLTPFRISVAGLCVNILLSLVLAWKIGYTGIAAATVIGAWLQLGLLLFPNFTKLRSWYGVIGARILRHLAVTAAIAGILLLVRHSIASLPLRFAFCVLAASMVWFLAGIFRFHPDIREWLRLISKRVRM